MAEQKKRLAPFAKPTIAVLAGAASVAVLKALIGRLGRGREVAPKEPAYLLQLPAAALSHILAALDPRDRARLLCTCRQMRSVGSCTPDLWRDVSLHLHSLRAVESFAAVLATGAPHLRTLRLTNCWLKPGRIPTPAAPLGRQLGDVDLSALRAGRRVVAAVAHADQLQALELTINGYPLSLAGWAGRLPLLRSLRLTLLAPLELPAALGGGLPALQELAVFEDIMLVAAGSGITLEPGCLPASLRRLELAAQFLRVLPPAVTQATQLVQLRLTYIGSPQMDVRGITQLSNLRELALIEFVPLPEVADAVRQLPVLQRLDMSSCRTCLAQSIVVQQLLWQGLVGIAGSASLRELSLSNWGLLERLPPQLLRMPELRLLHVDGNPRLQLEPPGAEEGGHNQCRLELLTLDLPAAWKNLDAFAALPSLRHLHLSGIRRQEDCHGSNPGMEKLRSTVAAMVPDVEVELAEGPGAANRARWLQRVRLLRSEDSTGWLRRILGH